MKSSKLLLSASQYFIINKDLAKDIGLDSALTLSELINIEESSDKNKSGYFITNINIVSKKTTLTHFKIKNSINKLYKKKFIDALVKSPEKIHVKVFHINILNYLTSNTISTYKESKLKIKKTAIKIKRFIKPTLKELKNYFLELGDLDESNVMFDYYESKGWKVGKAPMKCWKSATRNWIRRLNKKYNFPDYYDKQVEKQIGNDPETLSKYHNHLKKLGWKSAYSPSSGITWRKTKNS